MQKYKEPNWSPPNEDLFIFSVLTTILLTYDPIGILNALNYNFFIDDICDEYDTEAAAIMRCNDQWHDASRLGRVIKKILDHYFADNYPFTLHPLFPYMFSFTIDNRYCISMACNSNKLIIGVTMNFMGLKSKNKRKRDRKLCNTISLLIIRNKEHTCMIENISRGGALISIGVHFPLKIGELVETQIPFSDGKRYVKKTAKVKRFNDKSIAIEFLW